MFRKPFAHVAALFNVVITTFRASFNKNKDAVSPLRLVSDEYEEHSGQMFFVTQVIGKDTYIRLPINNFKDRSLLSRFDEYDQAIICRYLPREREQITKSIVARTFDLKAKKFIFTIETIDLKNNTTTSVDTDDLSAYIDAIRSFDSEDALLIGFELGKKQQANKSR